MGEKIFSLTVALLCGIYLFFSWKIGFGTMDEPEAGFMPVVLGTLGLIISLIIFMNSLRKTESCKVKDKISTEGRWRFVGCVTTSVIFMQIFESVGAILGIFSLILVLTKILGSSGWLRPVGLAVASSVIAYVLFVTILDVPLPRGLL